MKLQASIFGIKEEITFTGIKRSNSGVYSCSARNDVGDSPETQIVVDVKCEYDLSLSFLCYLIEI